MRVQMLYFLSADTPVLMMTRKPSGLPFSIASVLATASMCPSTSVSAALSVANEVMWRLGMTRRCIGRAGLMS